MGITLKQLTNTVSQIRDYVLHKTDKIKQISYAQKTVNTELDSCFCKLSSNHTPVAGEYVPFEKVSGSFEVNNGRVIVKPGQRVQISISLSYRDKSTGSSIWYQIKDYTNNIEIHDIHPVRENLTNEHSYSQICQYTNETNIECEIGLYINKIYSSDTFHSGLCSMTVQEIGRQTVIDPVEYVQAHQGIEDIPVGNIITHSGSIIPKHYLPCDGSEHNIADYPYLAQYIVDNYGSVNHFGGDGETTFAVPNKDMEYVDITPKMTSNNTPTPYVISADSEHGSQQAWKAFNGTAANGDDAWASQNAASWLKVDFGCETFIGKFALTAVTGGSSYDPKDFILYGSNNDVDYDQLYKTTNQTNWGGTETREYKLNTAAKYRYYKLEISANNGAPYTALGLLKFYAISESKYIKYEPTYFMEIQRNNTNYLSPTLYSQEERVIGSWIDGKPLYQKTVNVKLTLEGETGATGASNEFTLSSLNMFNIDSICDFHGFVITTSAAYLCTPIFLSDNYFVNIWITSNAIFIRQKGYKNNNCEITIRYTKTTDEPNSFTESMLKDSFIPMSYTEEDLQSAILDIVDMINKEPEPEEEVIDENTPVTIPELYPEMEDTPTIIPELYDDLDTPTIIPELGDETETPVEPEVPEEETQDEPVEEPEVTEPETTEPEENTEVIQESENLEIEGGTE